MKVVRHALLVIWDEEIDGAVIFYLARGKGQGQVNGQVWMLVSKKGKSRAQ